MVIMSSSVLKYLISFLLLMNRIVLLSIKFYNTNGIKISLGGVNNFQTDILFSKCLFRIKRMKRVNLMSLFQVEVKGIPMWLRLMG